MKTTLLIVISLVTFSAVAQNNPYGALPPPPPMAAPATTYIGDTPDIWGSRYFHFGLNITPGFYWANPNSANNASNGVSAGFGYGANLEFYFTRNYGFITGFELASMGSKYINTNANPSRLTADSTITHDVSLQYLELPLMLKMKTNPIGKMRYYGVVGLEAGFLLKATDDFSTTVTPVSAIPGTYSGYTVTGNNLDVSGQSDFFRVSLVFGLGAEYSLAGSSALQASLTYNNCFTNMNSSSANAVNIKGIELMIGVLF